MTLIEQQKNIQKYGDEGGIMNIEQARREILEHTRHEQENKEQKRQDEELIKKLLFDVVKVSGDKVVQQAIQELIQDFNKR